MPELPEVETTRRGIEPRVAGRRIVSVHVYDARLRWPVPSTLPLLLDSARIVAVERRSKYLLFRIAANKARDFRERGQAAKRGHGQKPLSLNAEDPETGLSLDPPSGDAPPDLRLLQAENVHLVHESLDRLGEPCREIIELRYFADLSYEEISASLGLNMKTVSSRLSKCLDKLELTMRTLFSGGQPSILPSNS